jgi:rhomboid family GlyGly-CTERM serine protease
LKRFPFYPGVILSVNLARESIAERLRSSLNIWGAPLCLMMVLLCTELLGDWGRETLRYDRGLIAAGQWWRMLSCNFVHLGWWHWFLNELGLLVLVLLCPQALSPAVWMRRLILLSLGMSVGLYCFVPQMSYYVGMSGIIHGLFVLGLMPQVLKKDLISACCLAYILGKLIWELMTGAPLSDEQAIGGHVAIQSHLFGAISALVYGLIFRSYTRIETFSLKGNSPP